MKPTSLLKTDSEHAYTDEYREVNPMQKVPSLKIGKKQHKYFNFRYLTIMNQ